MSPPVSGVDVPGRSRCTAVLIGTRVLFFGGRIDTPVVVGEESLDELSSSGADPGGGGSESSTSNNSGATRGDAELRTHDGKLTVAVAAKPKGAAKPTMAVAFTSDVLFIQADPLMSATITDTPLIQLPPVFQRKPRNLYVRSTVLINKQMVAPGQRQQQRQRHGAADDIVVSDADLGDATLPHTVLTSVHGADDGDPNPLLEEHALDPASDDGASAADVDGAASKAGGRTVMRASLGFNKSAMASTLASLKRTLASGVMDPGPSRQRDAYTFARQPVLPDKEGLSEEPVEDASDAAMVSLQTPVRQPYAMDASPTAAAAEDEDVDDVTRDLMSFDFESLLQSPPSDGAVDQA